MSRGYTPITGALAGYIRQIAVHEPDSLRQMREQNASHPHASMQIDPDQGQFLHFLTRLIGARKALEIGVFLGYSSTWIALALPAGGKLIACDLSEEYTAIARRTWRAAGVEDRIELRLAPAIETLDALIASGERCTFDVIFIDADKANYTEYYERALALLRPGGLIAADNVLWDGSVVDPSDRSDDTEAIRAFNRHVHSDKRVSAALATVGDGLMLACKL